MTHAANRVMSKLCLTAAPRQLHKLHPFQYCCLKRDALCDETHVCVPSAANELHSAATLTHKAVMRCDGVQSVVVCSWWQYRTDQHHQSYDDRTYENHQSARSKAVNRCQDESITPRSCCTHHRDRATPTQCCLWWRLLGHVLPLRLCYCLRVYSIISSLHLCWRIGKWFTTTIMSAVNLMWSWY